MDGVFRTLITDSWNAVFRYLLNDLKVVATQQNVDLLHDKFVSRYEAVCGERLVAPSSVSTGNSFNDNAYTRFKSALGVFLSGDGRRFVGENIIVAPRIAERFESSLQGGKMCPAGSPAHTRFMLRDNFQYYSESFSDQSRALSADGPKSAREAQILREASRQAGLVVSGFNRGFFITDEEIDVLRIVDVLISHQASRMLGASLLNLIRFEKFGDPESDPQSAELIPRFRPRFTEMARTASTFVPDWRSALAGIFRDFSESDIINRGGMEWEVAVMGEVGRIHLHDNPLINSLLTLMTYGFGALAQAFQDVIDRANWTPHSVVDVLLHVSTSQSMTNERFSLAGMAAGMIDDENFSDSAGDYPIPNRIAALMSYPVIHAETEIRMMELVRRMMLARGKAGFLGTEEGRRLVLLFLENLQGIYARVTLEERTREKMAERVESSVAAYLLQIAVTKPLSPARAGLITAALERMQGSYVNQVKEMEYFLKPLNDSGVQGLLDTTSMTWQEFLTYYYKGGRNGSNSSGSTSGPSGTVPVIPQASSGGGWVSSPDEEIDGVEITAADEVDYNEDYDYEAVYDNMIDQIEDGAFEYFGYYASGNVGLMEAMP